MPTAVLSRSATRFLLAAAVLPGMVGEARAQEQELGRVARSAAGVVVSGSPLATAAGLRMLEGGGNAMDAAVATAFALAVVEPSQSGLGGRTHMLIRTADGQFAALDGWTEVPAGATSPLAGESDTVFGYATIAVPGTVAALTRALAQHGSLPLTTVMAPAIELAERGFPLHESEARRLTAARNRLQQFPGSRAVFLSRAGAPPEAGTRFVQPALARVLRAVADGGAAGFYQGWVADSVDADMRRHGGLVRRADLERYQPDVARVVRGSYRGYELVGTYLPASGVSLIEALQILETFDLRGRVGSAEWVSLVAQALEASFEDRRASQYLPAEQEAAKLTSKAWARSRAGGIRPDGRLPAGDSAFDPSHTTHLSVIDRHGMVVALTQSLGPNFGSKVATPGLGFLYAATMGYLAARAPGDRPFSSQAPMIVLRDGRPVYVTGGGGGRRILSASVAVLSRLIDQRLSLADALAAPRFHPAGGRVILEDRAGAAWPAALQDRLAVLGLRLGSNRDGGYFARLHAIEWDAATNEYVGAADGRWTGAAAGVK
ncbi:MAG TPA: gamma-glutamyltransferase [Gemmatimonadales bacterium]|nr:gamma-glutamyltransferase [Gemmatimonadales bacterium]